MIKVLSEDISQMIIICNNVYSDKVLTHATKHVTYRNASTYISFYASVYFKYKIIHMDGFRIKNANFFIVIIILINLKLKLTNYYFDC